MTPGDLDSALLRRHLLALDQALEVLRRHRGRSREDLEENREELWVIERGLQLCAQNAIDAATHIAASAGKDVPDYSSAFDRLAELGILTREFAAEFRRVAGFRNTLVYGYLEVDVGVVHQLLNGRLEDFAEFARSIERHLARHAR